MDPILNSFAELASSLAYRNLPANVVHDGPEFDLGARDEEVLTARAERRQLSGNQIGEAMAASERRFRPCHACGRELYSKDGVANGVCRRCAFPHRKLTRAARLHRHVGDCRDRYRVLLNRITVRINDEFAKDFPRVVRMRVTARDHAGKAYQAYVVNPLGHEDNPVSAAELATKFMRLCEPRLGAARSAAALELWQHIEKAQE